MIQNKFRSLLLALREGKLKTLFAAISYGTASVLTQGLMMIYLVIAAHWLGAEKYGFIAAAHAATAMSAFIFSWGFNEWMIKRGSKSTNVEVLGGKVLKLKLLLGIPWGIGLWAILRLIRPELYMTDIMIMTITETWLDSTFGTLLVILILKPHVNLAASLLTSSRLLRLAGLFGLMLFGPKSVTLLLIIRLITTLIIFIITWLFAKPILIHQEGLKPLELLKQSSAFNTSEFLNLIFLHADVNILSWLGADLTFIANYSIVINLVNAVITLPSGIYNVLIPNLVQAYERAKSTFYRRIRWLYVGFFTLGILLHASSILLGKGIITPLLGETYSGSIQLLIWLSPLLTIRTLNQANIAYLIAVGSQIHRLIPQTIALAAKLTIGIIAVIKNPILGMVWVTIGSECLLLGAYAYRVLRNYHKPLRIEINEDFDDHI